jgi:hypothetical protein
MTRNRTFLWATVAAPTYKGPCDGHAHLRKRVVDTRSRVCRSLHRAPLWVPLIKFPVRPRHPDQPFPPTVRRFYWLRNGLREFDDPELERPGVVLLDALPGEDLAVATRSTTEKVGVFHARDRDAGLNKDGWFSRLRWVSPDLWTPNNAVSINLVLDEETYCYVLKDFLP